MKRKIIAAVLALSALTLGGCSFNSAEENEQVSEIVSAAAVAAVSQKAATESASVTAAEVTSVVTETEPPYIEDGKPPVIMAAEEFYDAYPVKIIYPAFAPTPSTYDVETLQEDLYNSDGILVSKFSAEYPVLFGYDKAVNEKINGEIHDYIYGVLDEEKKSVEQYNVTDYDMEYTYKYIGFLAERIVNMDGTLFDGYGCDINGNIFTVYFANFGIGMIDLHGHEYPTPMMFDLRTGDKIIFSELIDDMDKMIEVFAKTERRGEVLYGQVPCGKLDADKMAEYMLPPFYQDDYFYTDNRIMSMYGCIGFLLAPYENGSFADGVRFWRLPASEFIPYMNDKGKSLFEGYASADSEPPKVIEYKGKRWFDNVEWVPEIVDREKLTDYDREFILMFENARNAEYYLGQE